MPGLALPRRRRGPVSPIPADWIHPTCPSCGQPVLRRLASNSTTRETRTRWRERIYCSLACSGSSRVGKGAAERQRRLAAAVARFAAAEHAPCFGCQGAVPRREGEAMGRYLARATCKRPECRAAYRSHVMLTTAAVRKAEQDAELARLAALEAAAEAAAAALGAVNWIGAFDAHNIVPPPELGRVSRPYLHSYGVSAGWAVRE